MDMDENQSLERMPIPLYPSPATRRAPAGSEPNTGWSEKRKVASVVRCLLFCSMVSPCSAEADYLPTGERAVPQSVVVGHEEFVALGQSANEVFVSASGTEQRQTQRQSRGLGRTQKQILTNLNEVFPKLKDVVPVAGRPRRMGHADNMASIEIIGNPSDVYSATVAVGLPKDSPPVLMRNLVICFALIKNTLPNWPGGVDWLKTAFKKIADSPGKASEETKVGDATVTLQIVKQLGLATLTIERSQ